MRSPSIPLWLALVCLGGVGCSGPETHRRPEGLLPPPMLGTAGSPDDGLALTVVEPSFERPPAGPSDASDDPTASGPTLSTGTPRPTADPAIARVAHQAVLAPPAPATMPIGPAATAAIRVSPVQTTPGPTTPMPAPPASVPSAGSSAVTALPGPAPPALPPVPVTQLDLGGALARVDGQNPTVGFARWRVQEAYAQLDRTKVLWLPSIQPGFSYHRHDGNLQASDGTILDVNRGSFQYGLGAGATGAGTTPLPGVVARFNVGDAIFQPSIAEKTAWARSHAATAVLNNQLRDAATAYFELLAAEQDLRILEETRAHTAGLAKLTTDFAETGQGLAADADRLRTEAALVENRLASGRERLDVASARLAQVLSLDADRPIVPTDPVVVPIDFVPATLDKPTLIRTALRGRPELKESQALVAAACEQHRRQQYAPFVPSVLLGYSVDGFGGGTGSTIADVDDRYDFDAVVTWEVRNLGFGEAAARRETHARVEQAKFETVRVMDQVARDVSEAHSQVVYRRERIAIAQSAITAAEDSYRRNLDRIRDGQGLPIEVLQSIQALEAARRAYLDAVIDYDQAQVRLQWALGWRALGV